MRIRSEKVSGIIGIENWSRTAVDEATPASSLIGSLNTTIGDRIADRRRRPGRSDDDACAARRSVASIHTSRQSRAARQVRVVRCARRTVPVTSSQAPVRASEGDNGSRSKSHPAGRMPLIQTAESSAFSRKSQRLRFGEGSDAVIRRHATAEPAGHGHRPVDIKLRRGSERPQRCRRPRLPDRSDRPEQDGCADETDRDRSPDHAASGRGTVPFRKRGTVPLPGNGDCPPCIGDRAGKVSPASFARPLRGRRRARRRAGRRR